MASGTRLARMKMLEDDGISKRKTRELTKLSEPSSLDKCKFESVGKKMPDSPLRRSIRTETGESSGIHTNSKNHARPITTMSKKDDERIGHSSSFTKANKCESPPTKKRKVDEKSISLSTDISSGSSSAQNKMKMVNENSRSENKNEDSGKKTVRKLMHVRTYKRLVTKQANKGGNRDGSQRPLKENIKLQGGVSYLNANIPKEAQEHGDAGAMKGHVQDHRQLCTKPVDLFVKKGLENTKLLAATFDASVSPDGCHQECGTKLCRSNGGIKVESNILVESSQNVMPMHDPGEMKLVSSSPITEELGISGSGARDAGCLGTTCAEENINFGSIVTSKGAAASISNTCVVCNQSGQLICCSGKGCSRSYHLSCLDLLLHDAPPGAWLCNFCLKKKLESGVYSMSEGIESVWDVDKGAQSGKHYFIKYKGLAHVHNRWIPENKLLCEAPCILDKFRKKVQKDKVTKWRKEWAEPERLLQKRLVVPPDVAECTSGSATESSSCYIDWFVKWKGLHYDQATWELENSLLLCSPETARLIEDYECRHEQARKSCDPLKAAKDLQIKKDPFCKLSELPDGCPAELDIVYLSSLNRLRELWHKSANALLIDDQDRITKSILFVLSLQSHACQPSLITTTSSYLPIWQAELARLAPSLNIVLYKGSKDVRRMIRNLEFYEERGCIMFQVLLADLEAIIEDLRDITCIGWKSLIVDTCQNSKTSRYLEQLKLLTTEFKLLLFNAQLKDSLSECRLLLSFINNGGTVDDDSLGLKLDINEATGALAIAKEKLAHYIANECKADSSLFFEYWVPVPLSNVQLEQYCATLLSNSNVLRSNSKSDVVGALHNILITTRKCCDHPYLVDGELRGLLTKGLQGIEILNAEVCASGKLFLLDKILQEMKCHGLRVVILFQSLRRPGKVSLGDILDDFLQQRFGVDSYEHIETGLVMTKKVAALKMFNNKEAGRFVFLVENRACLPSVKLHSVDAIIIFDSDWNPLNDLRSLQKISIESQQKCIKVFRLCTSFTVEEKLLMFAKQDTILESNIENISRKATHSLLGWGASYLFWKLDQFHSSASPTCISEPSFDKLCLNDIISEILTEIRGISETTGTDPCSILIKARQTGATYPRNIVMMGEKEGISFPDKDPVSFWSVLLERRHPRWIHISERSQRIRRKVQNFDAPVKMKEVENHEVKKKRPKTNNVVYPVMQLDCSKENKVVSKGTGVQKNCMLESEGGEPKLEEQRNLLMLLRPELSKLCDVLGLPASTKGLAQEFLVYIMNNHDVCSKQVTVLQALKIALCWRAASLSRHTLDRIQSLALAKEHFKFVCTEEEAFSVYSRLRILKKKFPRREGALENSKVNSFDRQSSLPEKAGVIEPLHLGAKESSAPDTSDLEVIGRVHDGQKLSEQLISPQQDGYLILETPMKFQKDEVSLKERLLKDQIDLIEKISLRRSEDLRLKQQVEVSHFEKQMHEERLELEKAHDLDLEFIHSVHVDSAVGNGKINVLTQESSAKMGRLNQHLKQQKETFMSMQLDTRNKEQELKNSWLVKAKDGQLEDSFDKVPLPQTGFRLEKFKDASKYAGNCYNSVTTMLNSAHPSDETNTELSRAPPGDSTESEEGSNEDTSSILSGWEGNIRPSSESFAAQYNNLGSIEQVISAVEPSVVLPELGDVQPMNAEIPNPQPEFLNIIDSIARPAIHACQQGDKSNGPHVVPSPVINQGTLLTSVQGLACSVAASNLSNVETVVPAEQIADVVNDPTSLQIPEKAVNPSSSEDRLERTPSPHIRSAGVQQGVACAQSYSSSQQTEYPAQQLAVAVVVDNEPRNQMICENIVHPLRPVDDVPSQRTPSEHLRGTSIEPNHMNQLLQNVPSMGWLPTQAIYGDPFQNELLRICKQDDSCAKKHEDKKLKLQLECELEIEKVRRKYDSLLHDAEREYLQDKRIFQTLYDKVLLHKVLAEDIREKFYDHKECLSTSSKGPSQNLSQLQASPLQPRPPQRLSSVPSPAPPSNTSSHPPTPTINQASTASFLTHTRSRVPTPAVASTHSTGPFSQPSQVISSNTVRGSTIRPSPQVGRAPAPHLHRFRPQVSAPPSGGRLTPATCQQPLPDSTVVSTSAPSAAPMDLSSALPATSSAAQPSISPSCGISQPTSSGLSPYYVTAPLVEVNNAEPDLFESLLSNFPSTGNEFPITNMVDSTLSPNASPDVICLSDDE